MREDPTERDLAEAQARTETPPEPEPEPEPDTDGDEDGDEDESEGEPDEPQAETKAVAYVDSAKTKKALDGLQKHVAKRLGEILGASANDLISCELCTWAGTPGWRPAGLIPAEVQADVAAAIGYTAAGNLKADHFSQVCGECDGYGQVATGSKVSGQDALTCVTCKGMGWTPVGNERASVLGILPNGPAAAAPSAILDEHEAPIVAAPDPPEVAALKAAGYMVFPPVPS